MQSIYWRRVFCCLSQCHTQINAVLFSQGAYIDDVSALNHSWIYTNCVSKNLQLNSLFLSPVVLPFSLQKTSLSPLCSRCSTLFSPPLFIACLLESLMKWLDGFFAPSKLLPLLKQWLGGTGFLMGSKSSDPIGCRHSDVNPFLLLLHIDWTQSETAVALLLFQRSHRAVVVRVSSAPSLSPPAGQEKLWTPLVKIQRDLPRWKLQPSLSCDPPLN